jgi:DNA-directed RNA polymerase specialized sigma24 family protein
MTKEDDSAILRSRTFSELLRRDAADEPRRAAELLPLVYEELRALARARLAKESPGQTIQATALVHEAYLRLVGREDPGWNGRRHFFGAAALAMRRILVEQARRKRRLKHGGGRERVDVEPAEVAVDFPDEETADALGVSVGTIEREWRFIGAWLQTRQEPADSLSALRREMTGSRKTRPALNPRSRGCRKQR